MANNIKIERIKLDMSQKDLATAIAVSDRTIGTWETDIGSCSISKAIELSNVFGCSLDYLVGLTDERRRDYEIRNAHELPES